MQAGEQNNLQNKSSDYHLIYDYLVYTFNKSLIYTGLEQDYQDFLISSLRCDGKLQTNACMFASGCKWYRGKKMVPFFPLLFCESPIYVKENPDRNKNPKLKLDKMTLLLIISVVMSDVVQGLNLYYYQRGERER